ncbi:hypothetical protein F511_35047 [Dorcoceras hygrometricum]|uniref:Uncharacterized protein n=1 Tax=Dorcoceras hygrometricum TaxID=472368 RepID=A0A2Z7BBR2_9LAMI|nr:hypothetical protein F511_35047 [Dorcoceras hygrometricum]
MVAGELALLRASCCAHHLMEARAGRATGGRWMLKVAQIVAPIVAARCMLMRRDVARWPRFTVEGWAPLRAAVAPRSATKLAWLRDWTRNWLRGDARGRAWLLRRRAIFRGATAAAPAKLRRCRDG